MIPVSVPLVDDCAFELTETFQARLEFPGVPPERVTIDPGEANVTILDNDGRYFPENASHIKVFDRFCVYLTILI